MVIENIERHVGLDEPLHKAIVNGAAEVGMPTFLATVSISVVFIPVFLLTGTAKYLFSPLSLSVIISLAASLLLSFTLVPVLFKYLMASASRPISKREPTPPMRAIRARAAEPVQLHPPAFRAGLRAIPRNLPERAGFHGGPAGLTVRCSAC